MMKSESRIRKASHIKVWRWVCTAHVLPISLLIASFTALTRVRFRLSQTLFKQMILWHARIESLSFTVDPEYFEYKTNSHLFCISISTSYLSLSISCHITLWKTSIAHPCSFFRNLVHFSHFSLYSEVRFQPKVRFVTHHLCSPKISLQNLNIFFSKRRLPGFLVCWAIRSSH